MAKTFNLRSIRTGQQFDLPIKDTDGKPTGVIFTLASPTHPARKAADMARNRQLINEANKTGRVVLPDPAETEEKKPKDLAVCTLGWAGYADEKGEVVPFSTAAAEALYGDLEMQWLVDQVEAALGNKALFTRSENAS
jgi:hypothetical protein